MNICKDRCIKLFAELDSDKGCGLIVRKRQGLGKPSVIYVMNFNSGVYENKNESDEVKSCDFQRSEMSTSGRSEISTSGSIDVSPQEVEGTEALCIVLVVFIHTGFSALNNIILFAMPLFFAATGYTFSIGKRSFLQNIILRFKSIMLPYFFLMLFYTLIEMIRANLFGYGDMSIAYPSLANTVYGSGILPLNGGIFEWLKEIMSYKVQPQNGVDLILPANCHLWFLPAMFTAYVIFIFIVEFLRKNHLLKLLVVICLVLFASIEAVFPQACQLPYGLGRGAIGAAFMLFGFWIKEYALLENKSKRYYILTNVIAFIIFLGALYFGSDGSALVRSVYGPYGVLSVFATFIGGVAGIWLILFLCKIIEGLPIIQLKKILSFTGRNVMTVYAWHMAFKFLFDAVYICYIKASDFSMLDEYKMGLMPEKSFWFMLFEAIAVIFMCLLISNIKQRKENSYDNRCRQSV